MRDAIYDTAHAALTTLANNTSDTQETREAIDSIQKLLYRYHEATDTLESIEAKLFHFAKKEN